MTCVLAVVGAMCLAREPARFVSGPTAADEKDGVRVEFAVDRATDVAVEVLDAKGETVRHLAAGVLGDNAPEPLAKKTLAQALVWDRRDDIGREVMAGKYSVRVGLGLRPGLRKVENFEPLNCGVVFGLAALPSGALGVFEVGAYPDYLPRVMAVGRDGAYVRQLFPPPADLKPEASAGMKWFRRGDGRMVPLLGEAMPRAAGAPSFCPMAACGDALYVCLFAGGGIRRIDAKTCALGAPIGDAVLGQGKGKIAARAVAATADGKWLLLTGVETAGKESRPLHAVYRMPADGSEAPKALVGDPDKADKTDGRLNTPVGLAADEDGNVYVCDNANDRVAVFSAEGKFLRNMEVKCPVFVQARMGGGAVVVAGSAPVGGARQIGAAGLRVVLLSAEGKEVAAQAVKVPSGVGKPWVTGLALDKDAAGDGAVAWVSVGGEAWPASAGALLRYELRGNALTALQPVSTNYPRPQTKGPYDARYMYNWGVMDPSYPKYREALDWKYLAEEGAPFYSVGPDKNGLWADGRTYLWNDTIWYHKKKADVGFQRFESNRAPLAFAAFKSNVLKLDYEPSAPWFAQRGTMVDRRGHIWVRYTFSYPEAKAKGESSRNEWCTGVLHYDADGRKVGEVHLTHGTYGMGVDPRGNVYVGDKPRPVGVMVPEDVEKAFGGNVPRSIADWYGSVMKFGPAGGKLRFKKGAPAAAARAERTRGDLFSPPPAVVDADFGPDAAPYTAEPEGAQWMWVGTSPLVTTRGCICYGTSLAVDPHGRVFAPDKIACRVVVLDSGGNIICYMGSYGNLDSRGKGSAVPEPEIAFALVRMVTAATSREVRVADNGNGWVSVISLGYAREASAMVTVR